MKTGYGQFCPVAVASEIFAERWTPVILRELVVGRRKFNDIHRGVPRMSRALLVKALTPGFAARAAELSDTDDFIADTALPRRAGRALPPAAGRPAESACRTRGARNGNLSYGKNCTGADVPLIWLRCMRRTVFLSNSSRRCMVL